MHSFMKRTLFFVALTTLLTFTLALPTGFANELSARAKIGGSKPPPPPPTKGGKNPPPPPPPPPVQTSTTPSPCNGQKNSVGSGNCKTCVAIAGNACAFDRDSLQCVPRPNSALTPNLVTSAAACATLDQTSVLNPNQNVRQQAEAEFARMQNHIFNGETDPTSGRHTFSAWRSKNSDAGRCDSNTNLCAFRLNNKTPKTVWDDRNGLYTVQDIKDMCITAITLNIQQNQMRSSKSFAVQTKFGKSICVQHLVTKDNTPSCFPLGIHTAPPTLGSPCSDTGSNAINGVTTEVAAGQS
ncbi:unnamed protein product [Somion occarium]|uniref:Hemoglobin linker chain n=1 Tax=Somion occarium TaxID=3059160 RepID=A0ABP1E6J7_9APHY